jgi:hypothetical protein
VLGHAGYECGFGGGGGLVLFDEGIAEFVEGFDAFASIMSWFEARPWRKLLRDAVCLPSSVRGPVDRFALFWLAVIWAGEAIRLSPSNFRVTDENGYYGSGIDLTRSVSAENILLNL